MRLCAPSCWDRRRLPSRGNRLAAALPGSRSGDCAASRGDRGRLVRAGASPRATPTASEKRRPDRRERRCPLGRTGIQSRDAERIVLSIRTVETHRSRIRAGGPGLAGRDRAMGARAGLPALDGANEVGHSSARLVVGRPAGRSSPRTHDRPSQSRAVRYSRAVLVQDATNDGRSG